MSWQPLQIALAVSGDLVATLDDDGQAVTLRGAGDTALRYDHLAVYDALGQPLAARMELSGDELRLVVEEQQAVYPLTIDPVLGQQQKLAVAVAAEPSQSGVTDGAKLGTAVAISGNTAVVGAPNRIFPLQITGIPWEGGQAYIFVRNGSNWDLVQSFYHNGPGEEGKDYGSTIAISGDTIVVGSPKSTDTNPTYGCPLPTWYCEEVGRVYTYTKQADGFWAYQYPALHAPYSERRPFDQYGHSVALDGNTLLVGAWQAGELDQGTVYVYIRVENSWWLQATLTAPYGAADDRFGQAVAISGDTALIGAHNDDYGAKTNRGTVSVFVRNNANWTHQQTFSPADGEANDEFGCSVALSGDTALIGARFDDIVTAKDNNQGSAYVYTRSGTAWTQQQKLTPADSAAYDLFGYSVALYGNTALVGAAYKGTQSQGAAYVFNRNGVTWTQTKKLLAADAAANDHFGTAVALDGSSAVVGAPLGTNAGVHTGAAYVFFCAPFSFSPANLNLSFGRVGSSYSQTITASGGTSPYSYAVVSGTMAPGLTLSSGGVLSGTPTTIGNYYFYLQATDANGCTGTTSYVLTISPTCPTITINPATLPNGKRNVAYSQQLTASGGVAPYSFSVTGTLPTGLILSGNGQVVGTPTVAGSFTFRAKATDANGCSGLRQYTVTIN
ncbi:MAG: hypothetical protein HOP19_24495 [Acidobacteria bacterium]|nr:hypothetical protein [Acidobacteriota bacterium]